MYQVLEINDKYLISLATMSEHTDSDGFAALRIKRIVRETSDAVSLVLDVPEHCSSRFRYQAGQFLTLRVTVDGRELRRCYSMSSAPVEDDLQITVKRDPGGLVSNWLNDTAAEGAEIHAAPPEGRFLLRENGDAIVAFAGGSGITPIMSLIRTALATTSRPIRLFYANRSRDGVIFADALNRLAEKHADRLSVTHHFDDDRGVVTKSAIESFLDSLTDGADHYICGPGPFMDAVEATVLGPVRHVTGCTSSASPWRWTKPRRPVRRNRPRPPNRWSSNRPADHHGGVPGGKHPAADGADGGAARAGVVRDGLLRNLHGTDRRRKRADAQQRRARRRRGRRGLGADLPVAAHQPHGPRGLRVGTR